MFGSVVTLPARSCRRKPVAASAPGRSRHASRRIRPVETRALNPKHVEIKSADPEAAIQGDSDRHGQSVVKSTGAPAAAPAAMSRGRRRRFRRTAQAAGARRVAAVQRALTEYGYGQLKPTGTVGADTQAAISKFERDRKLPVTGQMSDRLVRELTAMIGHPID